MRDIAGRAPEITLLHLDFLTALFPDGCPFKQDAPLFLGMIMHDPFGVRRKRHHRQHGVLAGKNSRRQPGRELTEEPVMGVVQSMEFLLLAHHSSLVAPWSQSGFSVAAPVAAFLDRNDRRLLARN